MLPMKIPTPMAVARGSVAAMWLWLATSSFSASGAASLSRHLSGHLFLGGLGDIVPARLLGALVGALQLAAGVVLLLPEGQRRVRAYGAALSAVLAAVPMTLLFTNPVWMESLGGFPAIGSGQGLLKYAAVIGLSLYMMGMDRDDVMLQGRGLHFAVGGLMLPLLWIGAMKFTLPEAQGVQGLLGSSPFFAWMTRVFSVQGASNVIGITELITVGFLSTYWYRPRWAVIGGALGAGTFLGTLSFLVTVPGWHAEAGFPLLSGTGVFLVKDLPLLGTSAIVVIRHGVSTRGDASA